MLWARIDTCFRMRYFITSAWARSLFKSHAVFKHHLSSATLIFIFLFFFHKYSWGRWCLDGVVKTSCAVRENHVWGWSKRWWAWLQGHYNQLSPSPVTRCRTCSSFSSALNEVIELNIKRNATVSTGIRHLILIWSMSYPAFSFNFNDAANCQLQLSESTMPLRCMRSLLFLRNGFSGGLQTPLSMCWWHCSQFQDNIMKSLMVERRGSCNSCSPSCTHTSAARSVPVQSFRRGSHLS